MCDEVSHAGHPHSVQSRAPDVIHETGREGEEGEGGLVVERRGLAPQYPL